MFKVSRLLSIIALVLFVVSMGSCGGGGGGGGSGGGNNISTIIIGANGGSITSTDGKATVQIPAGALISDTTINIAIIEDNQGQVGSLYQVSGYGSADLVFLQPVTIKIKYDPNLLPTGTNEGSLQLALLEPFDSWEILTDSTVDEINHIISATTTHFSSIGILVNVPGGTAPKLIFPLPNRDPFNAAINSVFDHSMSKPYTADGIVKDYKGEVGSGDFCGCFTLKGQVLCCYGSGTSFTVNGNYAGGECGNVFLSYDGHPGYDYKTIDQDPANGQIDVLAAADGIAHVPSSSEYGTIWIDHGNGYSTWYLHLSKRSVTENQYVYKGDKIGVSGNIAPFYVGPHLHFEVRKNSVAIDPYAENLWETAPSDTTPPSVPTGLTATAVSSNQIDLSWNPSTDNVGVAGYKIYDYYGTYLKSVTSTSTSITGLNPNTYYCFTVSAYDAAGNESGQSSQACATTLSTPDTTPPSVPTNLNATAISSSQINLSWNASPESDVAGYKIYRNGSSTPVKTVSGTSTSDTGLSPSTQYCYRVTAYDTSNNESGLSNEACATTNSEAVALIWKKSGVWTGNQSGTQDAGSHFWNDPLFDDSSWSTVTLPDSGSDSNADDRYYRAHFTWDGVSLMSINFISDDGLAIYINGNLLGSWGNGWRQPGCINKSSGCSINTSVLPQTIPISMLNSGDNVMSVDLWNGAICCDYYLDITVNVIEECWPCEPPYCPPECM